MAVGQFFRVPFSFAASLFPGDTRLVSRGINFEFRSTQVKRFQRTWQVGEDSLFQASTSIIPNPCDKWYSTCLKTITPKQTYGSRYSDFLLVPSLFSFHFWLNSGTNQPVLGPKKTATASATAIGPLWSDGAIHGAHQQGSWGTSRLGMVTGYRPSMVTLRDSLFALSLHNQCHHCPEKKDKTWQHLICSWTDSREKIFLGKTTSLFTQSRFFWQAWQAQRDFTNRCAETHEVVWDEVVLFHFFNIFTLNHHFNMMHPIKFPNRGSLLLALRHAIPHALPVALPLLAPLEPPPRRLQEPNMLEVGVVFQSLVCWDNPWSQWPASDLHVENLSFVDRVYEETLCVFDNVLHCAECMYWPRLLTRHQT